MGSSTCRRGVGTIAGSVFALCLVFQTKVVVCGERESASEVRIDDPNATTSQNLEDKNNEGAYLPLVKVGAEYPSRAMEQGIEGSVTVKFTVTEKGSVEDPVVVESDPPGIFDRAAIQAASKFKYPPRVIDGSPIRVEGVKHKIVFDLEDVADVENRKLTDDVGQVLPLVKVSPKYPRKALSRGIEGSVTVEFTVTEKGSVEDPVVVESDPPGIFDSAAIDAVSLYKYRPKIVEGKPVRAEGVKNKIVFGIDD